MRCTTCQADMVERRESVRYEGCELRDVTLHGVAVYSCEVCQSRHVKIPRMAQLFRVLMSRVVSKAASLAPDEVRFLRKYIGFAAEDFAALAHVPVEYVSAWESGAVTIPIVYDIVLRMAAMSLEPKESYKPLEAFGGIQPESNAKSLPTQVRASPTGWDYCVAA